MSNNIQSRKNQLNNNYCWTKERKSESHRIVCDWILQWNSKSAWKNWGIHLQPTIRSGRNHLRITFGRTSREQTLVPEYVTGFYSLSQNRRVLLRLLLLVSNIKNRKLLELVQLKTNGPCATTLLLLSSIGIIIVSEFWNNDAYKW